MTRDDIVRIAQEAGDDVEHTLPSDLDFLERLASLVAEAERDNLRTKIEQMEKQEPVAWMSSRNGFICKENKNPDYNVPLVPLPGAKGEEK